MTKTNWQYTTLGGVCLKITDGSHWSPKGVDQGVPMASVKDMTDFGFNISTCKLVSFEDYQELIKNDCKPLRDDVLIAKDGSYLKHVFVWKQEVDLAILSSIAILRPNKNLIEPQFLSKYLMNPNTKTEMTGYVSGAALPRIILKDFINFRIHIPPLPTQRKIASILSAYDDLIENNLRRIKILEEMAQNLYREWFVKFRFPGHEKVQMVDSPMGKIPEGWDVTTLDSVLSVLESGSRPKGGIDPSMRDVPSIGAENILGLGKYDFSKEKFVSREFFEKMKRGHINNCDVLLYKDGAKIGRKSMFRDNFPHSECCINEHVFILRTNEKCGQAYLFFWLDQPDITAGIINLNANAAQPGINQKSVKGLTILLPDRKLLDLFDEFVEPLLAKLFNLAKKNQVLRRTRDLLLSKLISGELDISDLDIKTGGHMQ